MYESLHRVPAAQRARSRERARVFRVEHTPDAAVTETPIEPVLLNEYGNESTRPDRHRPCTQTLLY